MATTKDLKGNIIFVTDPNGNEISKGEKLFAGILLSGITLLTVIAIIAHWPDKLPPADPAAKTKYHYKWFAVNYLGSDGTLTEYSSIYTPRNPLSSPKKDSQVTTESQHDTNHLASANPIPQRSVDTPEPIKKTGGAVIKDHEICIIDLNTLILLLVALAGFLGNLIHVSASFTNFVGAGKFKRSWILWYCVKPFTASALAVGVYIIFRAGFLNSADATKDVNLYGVVAIALLAGLFTDMATQKLKEVFGVIFQSSNIRPNALEPVHNAATAKTTVTDITPVSLVTNASTPINISGKGLDASGLVIKVGEATIADADLTKTPTAISFSYTATAAGDLVIVITNDKGEELKSQAVSVIEAAAETT